MSTSSRPLWVMFALWTVGAFDALYGCALLAVPGPFMDAAGLVAAGAQLPVRMYGACTALFGVYLVIAARHPRRHWPAPALSLALKLVVPALVAVAAGGGEIAADRLWLLGPAYVIWWVPLAAIVWQLVDSGALSAQRAEGEIPPLTAVLETVTSQDGRSLDALARERPQLIVFLRHFGCTFCREALSDIVDRRHDIEALGMGLVLVHMADDTEASAFLCHYGLDDVPRISDPGQYLYRAADLHRGSAMQLLGPKVWRRALSDGLLKRHGIGRVLGDGFQMPGAFVVHHDQLLYSFRHRSAADRPDYLELARCGLS